MDCSTPGFPVPHHVPEFAQVHVHWISDAIQPSHPLLPSSLSAFNLSQHQGLFQWVSWFKSGSQSIGASASASELPVNIQGWFSLGLTGLISLLSKGLSRIFSSTTIWKHQFFSALPSLSSSSHICTWLLYIGLTIWTFVGKVMSLLFNAVFRFVIAFLPRSNFVDSDFKSPFLASLNTYWHVWLQHSAVSEWQRERRALPSIHLTTWTNPPALRTLCLGWSCFVITKMCDVGNIFFLSGFL